MKSFGGKGGVGELIPIAGHEKHADHDTVSYTQTLG